MTDELHLTDNRKKINNYLKKSIKYLLKYKKTSLIILTLSILSSVFESFSVGTIIPLFQSIIDSSQEKTIIMGPFAYFQDFLLQFDKNSLILVLIAFLWIMILLKNVLIYFNETLIKKIQFNLRGDLESDLFNKISEASLKFFHSLPVGKITGSMSVYTDNIASFIYILLTLFSVTVKILAYIVLMFLISWKLTIIPLILGVLFFPVIQKILAKTRKIGRRTTDEVSKLHFRLVETFNSIPTVKIFNMEFEEQKRFNRTTRNLARYKCKDARYFHLLGPLSESFIATTIFLTFLIAFTFIGMNVKNHLPIVVVFLFVFYRIFSQIDYFLKLVSRLYYFIEPFDAYEELLKGAKNSVMKNGNIFFQNLKEGINLQNVCFSYSDKRILNNINFFIHKGKFTAFVGATGSGKSTLAKLIAGLYFADSGKIYIDQIGIEDLDIKSWRSKIGFVTQETIIFNESAKYNISYGKSAAKDEEIIAAAKKANIHDFIMGLPEKYETVLGEKGVKLSGGQKQLISIARAILHKPQVLILDEATSSLDAKTEKKVQTALDKLCLNCTVIAIAHRLSTIFNADEIIVLNEGRIVEKGKHDDLIKKSSIYKKLYELQFKR